MAQKARRAETSKKKTPQGSTAADSRERPWAVIGLCVLILAVTLFRVLRAVLAVLQWDFLTTIPITVPPLFFLMDGLVWSGAGIALLVGLWAGLPWARWAAWITAFLYTAWTWIVLLFIKAPEMRHTRWPFAAAVTLLGLGLVSLILHNPGVRKYFAPESTNGS